MIQTHRLARAALLLIPLTLPIAHAQTQTTDPGVTFRIYEVSGDIHQIPQLELDQTPNLDELRAAIDFDNDDFGDYPAPFVTHVIGELLVTTPGEHTFMLTSDDGARVTLDSNLIINHDGRHGATQMLSEPIALSAGTYPIFIEHFDSGGSKRLLLEWRHEDALDFTTITSANLRTERDLTRVTSPGVKRIAGQNRPGDRRALIDVHPGWDLSTIRPEGFEPKVGAMCFLPDGRLVVGTFDPLQRDDRALPDIDSKEPDVLLAIINHDASDPSDITVEEIATDLYEPTGLCVVDGDLYVAHRKRVERLRDLDNDGYFETHELVAEGWEGWNYHQFAFGLVHIDGKLYTALSTAMAPPAWEGMQDNAGPNGPMRGGLVEIDIESNTATVVAGGFRTPNGLGLTPDGALIYLDNQGTWLPTSHLAEVIPGRFYGHYNWTNFVPNLKDRFPQGGHPSVYSDRPRTPAAVLLPQNEVVNSPTQPLPITSGPFKGQMLVGELTAGGIRRVYLERVNGQLQGALFRFTQGLESGVNRMAWAPDGSLIVAGIGAGGNWNWRGTQFGLQRLTPNGKRVFEMQRVRAIPTGFFIDFTMPQAFLDMANLSVSSWTYEPTSHYGGPKKDVRMHEIKPGLHLTSNRQQIGFSLSDFEPGRVYHIVIDTESVSGEQLWSTEAWYTLNQIPRAHPTQPSSMGDLEFKTDAVGVGVFPPSSAVTLMGNSSSPVMRYTNGSFPPDNMNQDDHINATGFMPVGEGSGNLVSTTSFADARLHIEWLSPQGGKGQMAGNSGVYLQGKYELQVLGTERDDTPPAMNEAGAIYNIRAADHNASNGPGQWQAYDIWFKAPRFDDDGNKSSDARATVYWNGQLIHDNVAIPHPTGSQQANGEAPGEGLHAQIGPLVLQDHASDAEGPVRYRNIWIAPLDSEQPDPTPGDWLRLFEDTHTSDWLIRGGKATYKLADGVLTGTTAPDSPNTFYTSAEEYDDFELIYQVRVHPELNSGVQIRSEIMGGPENRNGNLRGYQVEVDPAPRAFTAGIYDERRRGWLHPLHTNHAARRAFRPNEWNTIRVVAHGPIIRTWINGIPAAEIFDAMTASGHIGFQVHGVGKRAEPLKVEFRNARIRELN